MMEHYEIFYCKECKGFVQEVIEDATSLECVHRRLGDNGEYEFVRSDIVDTYVERAVCAVHDKAALVSYAVTQEVFAVILQKFGESSKQTVITCNCPEDTKNVIGMSMFINLLL